MLSVSQQYFYQLPLYCNHELHRFIDSLLQEFAPTDLKFKKKKHIVTQ